MIEFTDTAGDLIEHGVVTCGQDPAVYHIVIHDAFPPAIAEFDRDMARALAADLLAFADSTPERVENEG